MTEAPETSRNATTEQPVDRVDSLYKKTIGRALPSVAGCAIVPVLLIIVYLTGVGPWKRGDLADSDCYVHLLRAEELWTTRDWFDSVIERANAPYGDELHWTRPFDVLLLIGAVPASLFVDFRTALFWWGVIISPVFLFCTLLALRWAVAPLLSKDVSSLAPVFLVANLGLLVIFAAGRPDHHSLLVLLYVSSIGFTLRLLKRPFALGLCYGAGAIGALSLWVSVESIVPVGVAVASLAWAWATQGRESLGKVLHYSVALSLFAGLGLAIERSPTDYGAMELDRISIVYVSVLALLVLLWIGIALLDRLTPIFNRSTSRFAGLLLGAGALSLVMWLSVPNFFRSPLAHVDPEVTAVYVRNVGEMQPLFVGALNIELSVPLIGAAVLAIPFAFFARKSEENRICWLYMGSLALLFLLLSVVQRRWAAYSQVALAVTLAECLSGPLAWVRRKTRGFPRLLLRAALPAVCWCALAFSGFIAAEITGDRNSKREDLPPRSIYCHLQHAEAWQNRQLRIVAHLSSGGELLYRTRHEVLGTPYHRNTRGILDTHRILGAGTNAEALAIIRERGVDAILLFPGTREARFYCHERQPSTFYQRLCEGSIPPWCRQVELPAELSSALLFEVRQP